MNKTDTTHNHNTAKLAKTQKMYTITSALTIFSKPLIIIYNNVKEV